MSVEVVRSDSSSSTSFSFIKNREIIEEGDTVIIYLNNLALHVITVRRGCTLNMRYGALRHEFLVGKRYGTQISASAGYVYVLRANPFLWTRTLNRRTQILYTPDISTILMLLDAKVGSVVCETGTGSGSLSHALATTIAPSGHLYSHDIDETRVKCVEKDLKNHGLNCCTVVQQDVCEDGFFVENACDGVFLDLPAPWKAIGHGKLAISRARGGRIVIFSPCIEQVQKVCLELAEHDFIQVQVVEIVPRKYKVANITTEKLEDTLVRKTHSITDNSSDNNNDKDSTKKAKKRKLHVSSTSAGNNVNEENDDEHLCELMTYPFTQPTHTGYLISATLLPLLF